jgi:hypothetical protein
MLGIPNYETNFVYTTDEILSLCRNLAREIIGKTIECSWVAILRSDEHWLKDLPIILRIGGNNYEVCWMKFSDLSITKNLINVQDGFNWMDSEDEELLCDWQKNGLPKLQAVIGQSIKSIQLLEAQYSFGDNQTWLPNGVEFILSNGYLSIFNNLDENGISLNKWEGDFYRLTKIS